MPQDFFTGYVEEMLGKTDIGELSPEQKNVYIPQLVALLEERVGLELVPKLDDAQMKQFAELVDAETSADAWSKFWHEAVPNFQEEIKRILGDFAGKIQEILARSA